MIHPPPTICHKKWLQRFCSHRGLQPVFRENRALLYTTKWHARGNTTHSQRRSWLDINPTSFYVPQPYERRIHYICNRTATHYNLCQIGYVLPAVCLSVCLSVFVSNFTWNYWSDLNEIIPPELCLRTRQGWLNFESNPPLDPHLWTVWR